MVLPALRVADDDVGAARVEDHRGRDVSGVGSVLVPVHVLGGNADIAAFGGHGHGTQRREDRRHNHLAVLRLGHQRLELLDKIHRFGNSLEHLPVSGKYRSSHVRTPCSEVGSRQRAVGSRQSAAAGGLLAARSRSKTWPVE